MTQICIACAQSLKINYENLFMNEEDLILDFFGKIFYIVYELRSLEEVI